MFSLRIFAFSFTSTLFLYLFTLFPSTSLACPPYKEQEWYVKAGADPSIATGSEDMPFASLTAVQNASCDGDIINIIPVDNSFSALNGGIVLKNN